MKEVKNQNLWNFELGSQESMNVPIYKSIEIQQLDGQDTRILNYDFFVGCLLTALIVLSRRKSILLLV